MEAAASPFLPDSNIQFVWDSTSLGWFKDCPRKYKYHMIDGWVGRGQSIHLTFGIHYHSALESYDKARAEGADHEEALRQAVSRALKDSFGWESDHTSKNRDNLLRSVVWYCEQFKDDPAKTVVLANGKAAVELSFKMELEFGPEAGKELWLDPADGKDYEKQTPYILSGHIDRLAEMDGGIYVTDRKTTGSTLYAGYFDQYTPHNQMSLYSLAAKVIFETPVKGVLIDAVQIAVGFSRFSRGFAYRTDSQLEEWMVDLKATLAYAESCATAGYWPHNDMSCNKFGGCEFRGVCSKSPEVREIFLESDFEKKHWNPLQVR